MFRSAASARNPSYFTSRRSPSRTPSASESVASIGGHTRTRRSSGGGWTARSAFAVTGPRVTRRPFRRALERIRRGWRFLSAQGSSSLTRRIVMPNIAGLAALVVSILYLSQYRAGLVEARVQSLLVQGEIIAGAIAARVM